MKFNKLSLALAAVAAAVIIGCGTIQQGHDPLIVRVEQAETMAADTFDTVLRLDSVNRPFWRTNAPEFHSFCEWLRETQTVTFRLRSTNAPGGFVTRTAIAPRSSAMIIDLNETKLDYRSGKASSNTLWGVLTAVNSALARASDWATRLAPPSRQ